MVLLLKLKPSEKKTRPQFDHVRCENCRENLEFGVMTIIFIALLNWVRECNAII